MLSKYNKLYNNLINYGLILILKSNYWFKINSNYNQLILFYNIIYLWK